MDISLSQSSQRNIYSVEYGYDLNNNINRFVNKAGSKVLTTRYTYTQDNLNTKVTLPSNVTVTNSYDSLNRLNNYGIGTTEYKVSYGYQGSARSAEDESVYRTTKVALETMGTVVNKYAYDAWGNIISIKDQNG